jgi:lipopolysaccharide export LptBFGC system permease protein LptF
MIARLQYHLSAAWAQYFGVSTRAALGLYIRASLLVMFILLVIAIAIDLAQSLGWITDRAQQLDVPRAQVMAPYLLYRSVDIVTRLFPQACFFGLFFAEIIRARRYERIILALAGVSPAISLSGVMVFALFAGMFQVFAESWARPAAVFAQVDLDVGVYAHRFHPRLRGNSDWFISGDNVMRARVKTGPDPELRDVEVFRGLNRNRLTSIVMAERAVPTDEARIWRLSNVVTWTAAPEGPDYLTKAEDTADIRINLLPIQLEYHGIAAFYLHGKTLAKFAAIRDAPTTADADLAIWRRWSAIFLPGVFAFMGASLAQIGYPGNRQHAPRLVAFAVFGYLSIVSIKIFWSLGERSILSAPASVMTPLIFVAGIGILAQLAQTARKLPRLFPKKPVSG